MDSAHGEGGGSIASKRTRSEFELSDMGGEVGGDVTSAGARQGEDPMAQVASENVKDIVAQVEQEQAHVVSKGLPQALPPNPPMPQGKPQAVVPPTATPPSPADVCMAPTPEATPPPAHFYQLLNPAEALSMLESEMAGISGSAASKEAKVAKLRALIERESEAQHQQLLGHQPELERLGTYELGGARVERPEGILASWFYRTQDTEDDRFMEDVPMEDPDALGKARIGNYADAMQSNLDAAKHLSQRRHMEWPNSSGHSYQKPAGPTWGVSTLPPGQQGDASFLKAVSNQQGK